MANSLKAPPEACSILPNANMLVMDALKFLLPHMAYIQNSDITTPQWYLATPVTLDFAYIQGLTIPSASFIDDVAKGLMPAMKKGAISLHDPNGPNKNMPLWVIDYWQQVASSISILAEWRTSLEWLFVVENNPGKNINFTHLQAL